VAYTLGITNVDPIEHDLLFERFLNEERVSMPDIDVDMQGNQLTINKILKKDFPQEFKDLVVKKFSNATTDTDDYDETIPAKDLLTYWQKSRFGVEAVKNVLTKGTYGAKRAIETICKNKGNEFALSVNPNYGNYGGQAYIHLATDIKGSFFEKVGSNIESALETEEFQAVYDLSPAYSMIIDQAVDMEGGVMSYGVHASAEVKTIKTKEKPLSWQQDTAMNIDNTVTTGFDMKKLEPFQKDGQFMGGVGLKDDCLGLKTLNTIRDTMDIVRKVDGTELSQDIYVKSDYINDAKAFEAIRSGDLEGLFQIESSGMKQLAKKLQPDCFEDVVAMLALYRPGPLESGMVDDFVERKHGRQEIDYFDDSLVGVLEPILKNTYGVIVYQEQVMKIVQEVGGFSLGGADEVRRAMGKKIPEEMKRLKGEFVEGAIKKGYKSQIASDLFDLIVKFAGYGFNKSHSAAYAFVTMQTAYLKAHHPEAFYTAHFLGKSGTIENLETIIPEIEKAGVGIAPPDINISYEKPQLRNGKVNYGLDTIKGTRTADIKTIIKSREENGNFKDLKDLMERDGVNVSKATFEGLTKSGALDNLPLDSEGLLSSDQENQSSVSKRASLLAWHAKSQLVKEPTKTQQKKMDEDFENNKLLSTAQKSEFDILGSIVSGVDRKLLNPISLEEVKDILPGEETGSRKIRGDATIIELVSGTNKFGNFYKIRLLDKNNRQQTVTMSKNQISTMKKKGVLLKEGDAVEVTLNKSINIENDTVHVNLKDIVLYNENDDFNRQEILGADVFSVEDLDWSKLPKKASNPISLTDLDERVKERGSYPNGKKSQEFTYFLKGFQQTAKKTGYLLEVSDGENTTKVFVSGVSNIDEKLYAKNLNLPITMNFNRYESDFIMTAFNSKPKIHGIKALNPKALERERDYLSALGVINDDFDSREDENQEVIDGIKYPISFSAETRNGVQIFNRDPIKNIMKTGSTKCAMYSAADGETKLWINKVDAESAMVHFAQKDTGAKKSYSRAEQKGKPGITMRGFSPEDEAAVIEGVKSIKQVYYSNFVFTYGEKGAKEVIEILEARGFKDSTGMDIEPLDPPKEIELMEPCKYSNSPKKANKTNTQGNTKNNPKK
jgi:DNA polymerase III alpha subunit